MDATKKLLTAEDLAERWNVTTDAVWDQVDGEDDPLPFIHFGRGTPTPKRAGQKGLIRFRLETVLAWEARNEKSFAKPCSNVDADAQAVKILSGENHDGKLRGGRKGRAKTTV